MNSYPGPYGQVLTNLVIIPRCMPFRMAQRGSVHIAAQASGKQQR